MKLTNIKISAGVSRSSNLKKVILANLMAGRSNTEIAVAIGGLVDFTPEVAKKKLLGYIGSIKKELKSILEIENENEKLEKFSKYFKVNTENQEVEIEDYVFGNVSMEIAKEIYNHYHS